jgi:hypothetical protein
MNYYQYQYKNRLCYESPYNHTLQGIDDTGLPIIGPLLKDKLGMSDAEAAEAHAAGLRNPLHQARRTARTAAETSGFVFNGHPFDSDRDSILRIANAATTALTANLVGAPFATEWHCADGYDMPMDAAGVMAMQGALAAHGQACHDRSSVLRAMIEAPEADLDALAEEIKTGWPG